VGILAAVGGALGLAVSSKVGPTELPQTVAAFHSLVGIAATLTAIGEYMAHGDHMSTGALVATYLATVVGAVTATGSVVAFAKLNGSLGSKPLALPGRDLINVGLLGATFVLAGIMFAGGSADPATLQVPALGGIAFLSALLGAHLTASIGAADTPVVITVLNSYSGWALCAEGLLLENTFLTSGKPNMALYCNVWHRRLSSLPYVLIFHDCSCFRRAYLLLL